MIIVKLQGGLGNQMFQYAAAAGLPQKDEIFLDLSFLKRHDKATATFTPRQFELGIFPYLNPKPLNDIFSGILGRRNKFYRILRKLFFPGLIMITDTNLPDKHPGDTYKTVYFDGYFQNENNFKHIREKLIKDFEFPALKGQALTWSNEISRAKDTVSIHVRRGDYLKPDVQIFHGVLPLSYYKEAQKIIEDKIKNPQYYVFSDDPDWCSSNLSFFGNSAVFIKNTNQNSWEDMCLMSRCSHHIIANSSYSWWGAWLNKKESKTVIAPDKWFAQEPFDIVPEEWIKI